MSEMMRAAMLYGPGDLRVEQVARPEPAADQVLIRIRNCGVCPSDVRSYTGERSGGSLGIERSHGAARSWVLRR